VLGSNQTIRPMERIWSDGSSASRKLPRCTGKRLQQRVLPVRQSGHEATAILTVGTALGSVTGLLFFRPSTGRLNPRFAVGGATGSSRYGGWPCASSRPTLDDPGGRDRAGATSCGRWLGRRPGGAPFAAYARLDRRAIRSGSDSNSAPFRDGSLRVSSVPPIAVL
jgi:hypothetical protein